MGEEDEVETLGVDRGLGWCSVRQHARILGAGLWCRRQSGILSRVPRITVTLLGGFAAAVDGASVPEGAWRLKKARELVKLLALAPGHRLHREQAMDVLWRDRDPGSAANNLHQAVHVARRALAPEAIVVRDEALFLVAEIDVDRLEAAAADARRLGTPAAYRAAGGLN